jgi:hypothetical protein
MYRSNYSTRAENRQEIIESSLTLTTDIGVSEFDLTRPTQMTY